MIEPPRPIVQRSAVPDGFNYGEYWLVCPECSGEWVGYPDIGCAYCAARHERMDDDRRKELLWPSWSTNGNSPRYDELSDDISREVWRKTRGQKTDADSMIEWVRQLTMAVKEGLITQTEAEMAISRIGEDDE